MPACNPEMEAQREAQEALARKERLAQVEAADSLVELCEECTLPWGALPAEARERIGRQVQLAQDGRCFHGLADLLGVDDVDRRFCAEQVSGQLKSSTELMLEDVERGREEPLPAALLLRFLLERRLMRLLADVALDVREACARRRQLLLLGRTASPMDSGYQSGEHSGTDIVGQLSEPPDNTLVKAAPVRSSSSQSCFNDESPFSEKKKKKKLMLTYAADGSHATLGIAQHLKELGFRVMLLEEQRRHIQPDPYSAVQKWFRGVNYIIPVLTPEYLAATQNLAQPQGELARRLAADVRFIYSLMCAEMEENRHVNYRVRAVVPDGQEQNVRDHPLYGSPLFRFPFLASDLEMLAECLGD